MNEGSATHTFGHFIDLIAGWVGKVSYSGPNYSDIRVHTCGSSGEVKISSGAVRV